MRAHPGVGRRGARRAWRIAADHARYHPCAWGARRPGPPAVRACAWRAAGLGHATGLARAGSAPGGPCGLSWAPVLVFGPLAIMGPLPGCGARARRPPPRRWAGPSLCRCAVRLFIPLGAIALATGICTCKPHRHVQWINFNLKLA